MNKESTHVKMIKYTSISSITIFFVFCLTTSMRVTCILLLSLVISEKTIFQTKYFNKIQSYFSFPPRITSWRPFSWSYEDIVTISLRLVQRQGGHSWSCNCRCWRGYWCSLWSWRDHCHWKIWRRGKDVQHWLKW